MCERNGRIGWIASTSVSHAILDCQQGIGDWTTDWLRELLEQALSEWYQEQQCWGIWRTLNVKWWKWIRGLLGRLEVHCENWCYSGAGYGARATASTDIWQFKVGQRCFEVEFFSLILWHTYEIGQFDQLKPNLTLSTFSQIFPPFCFAGPCWGFQTFRRIWMMFSIKK